MSGLIAEFNEGGVFMYVILVISLFSLAMIIRKVFLLWIRYRLAEDEITKAILKQIEANNYARAIQYCNGKNHPLTAVIKAGLIRANKSEKEIRRAIEVAAADEIPRFKRGVNFLPHMANISTMVGLLGTIRGLILAFSGMSGGDAVKRQEALSSGIALAFRATFFALSVAAFLVFMFVVLSTKQNKMVEKMEHVITSVVDLVVTKNQRMLSSQKGSWATSMSMLGGDHGGSAFSSHEEEEVFLNLTPMIDILTCLLFFLLLSFGAVIIALINASVPVISDSDPDPNFSKYKITMGLQITDQGFLVTASHDRMPEEELAKMKRSFGKKKGEYDYDALHNYLYEVKGKFPNSSSIIITPSNKVTYEVIVKAMDASRDRPGGTPKRPIRVPMFPEAVISTLVEWEKVMAIGHKSQADEAKEIFLNLTPMIDILTCLLFFLLLGYKSQSVMLEGAQGIQLPPSISDKGLVVSLTLTVTETEIKMMDSHIMFLKKGMIPPKDLDGVKIVPLYNRMARLLQLKKLDPANAYVLLLADKRLTAETVTKVMKTCGMAGLPNFHFGVARP